MYTFQQICRLSTLRLQNAIIHDAFRASVDQNLRKQAIPTFVQIRSANANFRFANASENQPHNLQTNLQLDAALAAKRAADDQSKEALALAVQEE
ncbi:hypothetical protein ABK046_44170, partial [Streptomyces caeruleatus]